MSQDNTQLKNGLKQITKLWLSGDGYSTFIIPKLMARDCGLSNPCYIVIEKTISGLLIKKLTIEDGKN